jgi:hypothetical protein
MQTLERFLILTTTFALFASLGLSQAIVTGFNSTTDGPNDDGTYTAPNGCVNPFDGGTCPGTPVPIGFSVDYFGQTFDSLYINTNGNITFDAAFPFVQGILQSPLGLLGAYDDIIAPFLADVDTRVSGTVSFGTGTYSGYQAFGVNWTNVGYFDQENDKLDNFQVLLVNRPDEGSGDFDIVFNYGSMQWETGDADFGSDGLGGYSAIAGFTDGTGDPANTFQLPGSSIPGSFVDGGPYALMTNSLNSDVPGRYVFDFVDGAPAAAPEPGTFALLLSALGVTIYLRFVRASRLSRIHATPGAGAGSAQAFPAEQSSQRPSKGEIPGLPFIFRPAPLCFDLEKGR